MPISTTTSGDGSVYTLKITGHFDVTLSTSFADLMDLIPERVDVIRIDLAEMLSSDASFLSSILLLRDHHASARIEVFNCSKSLARRFAMAGVDRLVQVSLSARDHQDDKSSTDEQASQGEQ